MNELNFSHSNDKMTRINHNHLLWINRSGRLDIESCDKHKLVLNDFDNASQKKFFKNDPIESISGHLLIY